MLVIDLVIGSCDPVLGSSREVPELHWVALLGFSESFSVLELDESSSVAEWRRSESRLLAERSAVDETVGLACSQTEEIVLGGDVACVSREVVFGVLSLDFFQSRHLIIIHSLVRSLAWIIKTQDRRSPGLLLHLRLDSLSRPWQLLLQLRLAYRSLYSLLLLFRHLLFLLLFLSLRSRCHRSHSLPSPPGTDFSTLSEEEELPLLLQCQASVLLRFLWDPDLLRSIFQTNPTLSRKSRVFLAEISSFWGTFLELLVYLARISASLSNFANGSVFYWTGGGGFTSLGSSLLGSLSFWIPNCSLKGISSVWSFLRKEDSSTLV